MAPKKPKVTELEVFSDKAARANSAIFDVLAKERPKTIKQILKQISKYEGLEETYYASLTKRLHSFRKQATSEKRKQQRKTPKARKDTSYDSKPTLPCFLKKTAYKKSLI